MTIDDKNEDEKLQYEINREAAKISALSSGKIDKYEYHTSEEILSSDQSRIIEQAQFTYSPFGKACKKQIKTIEYQRDKQTKALEEHGKQLVKYIDEKESLTHVKQKELANRRMEEIKDLCKQIDFNNLVYRYEGNTAPKTFIGFRDPLGFYESIKEG